MGGPLVTPWVSALSELTGEQPIDLLSFWPALRSRPEFQESGLFLWRNKLDEQGLQRLTDKLKPIMHDIHAVDYSKRMNVANYKSFQAVSSARCSCKYNYAGAGKQLLYQRGVRSHTQPQSVSDFLDDMFGSFEAWNAKKYSVISTCCDPALGQNPGELHKPRDFNLLVVNEYDYSSSPQSHIPWHDDTMTQSCRNDWDCIVTPVISISFGDSAIFL